MTSSALKIIANKVNNAVTAAKAHAGNSESVSLPNYSGGSTYTPAVKTDRTVEKLKDLLNQGGTTGTTAAAVTGTQNSSTDAASLSQNQLNQIQTLRDQANKGLITWDQANQQANTIRASAGYSMDKAGNVTQNQPTYMQHNATDAETLTQDQLDRIQSLRDQANKGLITWDEANQGANAIRASAGYSVDKSGVVAQTQTQYPTFENYLSSMGWDSYSDAAKDAIQASVDSAVASYNKQIEDANTQSAETARQAYIAKMLGQKNLDQQLSANGYAGGMADSQRIKTETDYQNNLTSIQTQLNSTIANLKLAITQAQAQGDQELASELAGALQQMQSNYTSYVQSRNSLAVQQQENAADRAAAAEQNKAALAQNAQDTAYTRAMNDLQLGILPDSATLTAAGIDSTTASAIQAYYKAQTANPTKASGTSSTGGNTRKSSSGSANSNSAQTDAASETQSTASTGMNNSYFTAFAKSISAQLQSGTESSVKAAQATIKRIWSSLSDTQKQSINTLVGKFGY